MHRLVLFLLIGLTCPELMAQEHRAFARRYGIEDGLPHRQVNNVIQDRRGFIWAATNGGVTRFDGRHFKVFNQAGGLPGDLVEWVMEDANGYIWASRAGDNSWLRILEPLSGKVMPPEDYFRQWPPPELVARWWEMPVAMADGSLLIGLHNPGGLLRFHPCSGWSRIPVPEGTGFRLQKIGAQQTIWGFWTPPDTSRTDLLKIDTLGRVLRRFQHQPGGWSFWDKRGTTDASDHFFLTECKDGEKPVLWEIDEQGEHRKTHVFADNVRIKQYCRLDDSRIEVQFPYVLDSEGHNLLDIRKQYPEIDPTQFRDYLQDRNGNLWFATTFGLIVLKIRKNHFQRLLFDEKAPGGRGYACRGLLEKNGRLLVNLETAGQGRFRVDPHSGFAERLPGKSAIGIAPAGDGNVWTECMMDDPSWQILSLFKAGPDGQLIRRHLLQQKDFGYIWSILEESPRRVLLGHINGLTIYNPFDGSAAPWHDTRFPEFDKANISWLGKDRGGQTWVCSEQGMFRMQPGGGVAARYWSGGAGEFHLPYDNIYHFYEDQAGVFWLGTGGGGLIRWDRKAPSGHQTRVISRENGLLNGVVYAAYEDQHNHLWLPTDFGIAQLDKASLQVRHTWLMADGLTHNEFNRTSHCRGADGTLYFGGLNGVTAFKPDDFYQHNGADEHRRTLALSAGSILKAGSDRLENCTAEILHNNQITIHPGDRYVQLEFALLEYFEPEKVIYTWKLEGLGAGWESLTEPVLRLSGLPFGTHRLRIRAQAADGALAANELNIQLLVLAPVYLRWWFIALAVFLLALGIWFWLRWRTWEHRQEQERLEQEVTRQTATIRRQTEELEQLDQIKSRFFANVSHELRTPLTLLLGPIAFALNDKGLSRQSKKLLEAAQRNSLHLQQLVNEILDISKLRATGLDLQEQPTVLFDFLEETLSAFQALAESRSILLQLEYLPDRTWTLTLDRPKLLKILGNLLSNALKFAPNDSPVVLQVERQAGDAVFRVQDEGPGIHPDDLPYIFDLYYQSKRPENKTEGGTGIGLALARELAQAMGGSLWAESKPGKGSMFFLRLPAQERSSEHAGQIARGSRPAGAFGSPPEPPAASEPAISAPVARLLVVEDNTDLQTFLRVILPSEYHLTVVGNGRAALDYLSDAERLPDLILTDVMMPQMDGFQLLEALRRQAVWQPIPVILLTALAASDDRLRAFRIGIDDYITKPFSAEELIVRIDNALRNQASRREWQETEPLAETEENTDAWLLQLRETARQNLSNPLFTIDDLAERMGISRRTLYRQIRLRTGLSANQIIQELRLLQARELIETGQYRNLRLVAEAVGLRSANYLSRLYRERFGKSPADDL